jgi:N-acetylmuramoyl-L-alanine amidase
VKTIVLDAGHGGKDNGAVGNGIKEKDITIQIVKYIKVYLESNYKDIKVLLTRSTDVFIELIDRSKFSNNNKADLFMSVHINALNATSKGFETYIYDKTTSAITKTYQKKIHARIVKEAPFFTDRGLKSANFSVLRNTVAPAILTESGFITNKADSDVLKDQNKLKALAIAHALGIAEALNLALKPSTTTPTNTVYKVGKPFDTQAEAQALLNSLLKDGHKGFTIYTEKN